MTVKRGRPGSRKNPAWALPGMRPDVQSITSDWESVQPLIDGVAVLPVRNVLKDNGSLVEMYRSDWGLAGPVGQVFQVSLTPGAVSAWHAHQNATDRLFVCRGSVKIVLHDVRKGSPSLGRTNELRFGESRPALLIVPPGVWHGVQNIGAAVASVVNMPDRAYDYESPDHWRLPEDTRQIPYRFGRIQGGGGD